MITDTLGPTETEAALLRLLGTDLPYSAIADRLGVRPAVLYNRKAAAFDALGLPKHPGRTRSPRVGLLAAVAAGIVDPTEWVTTCRLQDGLSDADREIMGRLTDPSPLKDSPAPDGGWAGWLLLAYERHGLRPGKAYRSERQLLVVGVAQGVVRLGKGGVSC